MCLFFVSLHFSALLESFLVTDATYSMSLSMSFANPVTVAPTIAPSAVNDDNVIDNDDIPILTGAPTPSPVTTTAAPVAPATDDGIIGLDDTTAPTAAPVVASSGGSNTTDPNESTIPDDKGLVSSKDKNQSRVAAWIAVLVVAAAVAVGAAVWHKKRGASAGGVWKLGAGTGDSAGSSSISSHDAAAAPLTEV